MVLPNGLVVLVLGNAVILQPKPSLIHRINSPDIKPLWGFSTP